MKLSMLLKDLKEKPRINVLLFKLLTVEVKKRLSLILKPLLFILYLVMHFYNLQMVKILKLVEL